jgi:NAD(P)-dependent dehydrogenase (short-subunit alcohol dehydrogenase family)
VALAGYAKGIARDLGPRNITVNVVQPGIMPTDMASDVAGELPDREAILDMHPIRRIATLEEVAGNRLLPRRTLRRYINGETVNIAGGLGI